MPRFCICLPVSPAATKHLDLPRLTVPGSHPGLEGQPLILLTTASSSLPEETGGHSQGLFQWSMNLTLRGTDTDRLPTLCSAQTAVREALCFSLPTRHLPSVDQRLRANAGASGLPTRIPLGPYTGRCFRDPDTSTHIPFIPSLGGPTSLGCGHNHKSDGFH